MFKKVILSTFSALSLSTAHAASAPPSGVKVFVREVANPDKTYSYHYRIVNESKEDMDGFRIGMNKDGEGLLTPNMFAKFKKPKNWVDPDNNERVEASVSAPEGYEISPDVLDEVDPDAWFVIVDPEEVSNEKGVIRDGQSLSGFVVQTKKREPVFTTSGIAFSQLIDRKIKQRYILPQKEVLSEKELAAKPTFTKLTVSPQTLQVEKFSDQLIPLTASIEATSGDSKEPVTRIHDLECKGNGKAYYLLENERSTQFQREKKFFIRSDRSLREVTQNGKAECFVQVAVSNTAGNRIFKKATFFVTSTPLKK